jgi:CheY-like chemotaxis protein
MAVNRPFMQHVNIVIVDDNADLRLLIARLLAGRGAQVFAAKNAFEALRLVREIGPDIVLSDLNMPRRSGFELLADIQALNRSQGGRIPVVAMTAHNYGENLVTAAGFQKLLRKPFSPDELVATINSVLQR